MGEAARRLRPTATDRRRATRITQPETGPHLDLVREKEPGSGPYEVRHMLGDPIMIDKAVFEARDGQVDLLRNELTKGHYRLTDLVPVGKGGMGEVFRARLEPLLPEETPSGEVHIDRYREAGEILVKLVPIQLDRSDAEERQDDVEHEIAQLMEDNALYDAWMLRNDNSNTVVYVMEIRELTGGDKQQYLQQLIDAEDVHLLEMQVAGRLSDEEKHNRSIVRFEAKNALAREIKDDALYLQEHPAQDTRRTRAALERKRTLFHRYDELSEQEGRYSSRTQLDIMVQFRSVLLHLAELARRGVQHTDVKPGNIIVNDLQARLIDFGIAKKLSGDHDPDKMKGTPMHMSPDVIHGAQDVFFDLYALATVTGLELGVIRQGRGLNSVHAILTAALNGRRHVFEHPSEHPDRYRDQPVLDFIALIDTMAQTDKRPGEYGNPFGSNEYTRENLEATIERVLALIEPMIQAQIRLVENKLAENWLDWDADSTGGTEWHDSLDDYSPHPQEATENPSHGAGNATVRTARPRIDPTRTPTHDFAAVRDTQLPQPVLDEQGRHPDDTVPRAK